MKASGQRLDIRLSPFALIVVIAAAVLLLVFLFVKPNEMRAGGNLVSGKLAFGTRTTQFSGQSQFTLRTSFGDGSGGPVTIAGPAPAPSQPTWSPDGARIAFVAAGTVADEIYVINADGSNPVNLTMTQ